MFESDLCCQITVCIHVPAAKQFEYKNLVQALSSASSWDEAVFVVDIALYH